MARALSTLLPPSSLSPFPLPPSPSLCLSLVFGFRGPTQVRYLGSRSVGAVGQTVCSSFGYFRFWGRSPCVGVWPLVVLIWDFSVSPGGCGGYIHILREVTTTRFFPGRWRWGYRRGASPLGRLLQFPLCEALSARMLASVRNAALGIRSSCSCVSRDGENHGAMKLLRMTDGKTGATLGKVQSLRVHAAIGQLLCPTDCWCGRFDAH
eukprot:scaffold7709_cov32-Tisochrysis_lutea.AAC.6